MRVALVYDRVNKIGGAERVLEALHQIWPKAPLFTAVYYPKTAPWAKKFKVIPSFLNKFPFAKKRHEAYPYLMPLAFESFSFDEYDVVISVTSEAAKGIITKPKTFHICYCLTPTRYLWSGYQDYFQNKGFRFLTTPIVTYLRSWDKIAAQRPDVFLAISENVKRRIRKYYNRNSNVIYPPVDTKKWQVLEKEEIEDYFLLVSRLDFGYKKVDLAIEAFNQLGLPLKIIGTGSQMRNLKRKAQKNIEFLGQLTDKQLLGYYQRCQAVIFPQEEDFGLVLLETQASGRPVIAFRKGGALETVIDPAKSRRNVGIAGQEATGLFFTPQTPRALVRAVKQFDASQFKPQACRQNAEKFSQESFKKEFKKTVEEKWKKHQKTSTSSFLQAG
ncbi:glycosyltransferase [Patescibacteria group bacterium]|nr:glycosyltransferase [Patescibacteria group bacterium]